jgi:small-conductance mechanosensitive channel
MSKELSDFINNPDVMKLFFVILVIILLSVFIRVIHRYIARIVANPETRYRTRKVSTFFIYILGIVIVATIFSNRLGGISIFLGITGAGIAFALQEVIVSIAGWIAISFGDFFSPGDRIQIGAIKGDVIDIGILRTTLMEIGEWVKGDQYTGRIVRITNSLIFREAVFNYTSDFPFIWDEVMIPIKYGGDQVLAKEIFQKIADEMFKDYYESVGSSWKNLTKRYLVEDASLEPKIFFQTTDNWMEFSVRYVVEPRQRRSVRNKLFCRIFEKIEETEGKIEIASTTIQLVEFPPVNVKVSGQIDRSSL